MLKIFKIYTLLILLSAANICCADCVNKTYFTTGANITVSGIIESVIFWGPPNFGESPKTDQKYTGAILHLDCPIYIPKKLNPESFAGNISGSINKDNSISIKGDKIFILNVRIEQDDVKRIAYRTHNGWRARITGILRESILPSDHTPIVLDEHNTKWLGRVKGN
jgi:hypothetical protein